MPSSLPGDPSPPPAPAPPGGPSSLKVMTLNIAHGRGLSFYQGFHTLFGLHRNLERIAALLRAHQPDLVALQEVDTSSHWNRRLDLLEHLRELAAYPYSLAGIHNLRAGHKPLAYGNGLLSRFPLHEVETVPFGQKPLGEKGFLYAEADLGSDRLPLVNLHLDYASRQSRLEQVGRLLAYLETKRHRFGPFTLPPLICGDFNSSRRSTRDAVHTLFASLSAHGPYQLFPENARTWPVYFPSRSLDFIFLPAPFLCQACSALPELVSDHRPVLLQFSWPAPSPPP